jgi:hypothetical protein
MIALKNILVATEFGKPGAIPPTRYSAEAVGVR